MIICLFILSEARHKLFSGFLVGERSDPIWKLVFTPEVLFLAVRNRSEDTLHLEMYPQSQW